MSFSSSWSKETNLAEGVLAVDELEDAEDFAAVVGEGDDEHGAGLVVVAFVELRVVRNGRRG